MLNYLSYQNMNVYGQCNGIKYATTG